jgi:hypothetical protein
MKAAELTGKRFGRLVAVARLFETYHGSRVWECICDCGTTVKVATNALTTGNTRSCGCLRVAECASRTRDPETRFRRSCIKQSNGCWLWHTSPKIRRYASFWINGAREQAHRASWLLFRGPIPDGLHVLHKCDTPLCVNPEHLFVGTHADNMADMKSKGRARSGRGSHAAGNL